MTEIYNAIGLQTIPSTASSRVGDAPDYERNLRHLDHMIDMAVPFIRSNTGRAARPCERRDPGFPGTNTDLESAAYARSGAIDIPPVTDRLAEKAVQWNLYLIGQAKARMPEFPDRFFNTGFIIDPAARSFIPPQENVVFTIEHTTTPHDV